MTFHLPETLAIITMILTSVCSWIYVIKPKCKTNRLDTRTACNYLSTHMANSEAIVTNQIEIARLERLIKDLN